MGEGVAFRSSFIEFGDFIWSNDMFYAIALSDSVISLSSSFIKLGINFIMKFLYDPF